VIGGVNAGRARLAAVIFVLVAGVATGGWMIEHGFRERAPRASSHLFEQVMARISASYIDSLDMGTLYTKAAEGMVEELGDAHSRFLDSARLARVQSSITGLVGSLGLDIDVRDGAVNVVSALPGTPAELAGLRSGDRIIAVDGRPTRDWTTDEARRALRGSPGTSVTVTVQRLGAAGKPTALVLTRDTVYVRPVQRAIMVAGTTGYVNLRTFSDSAAFELGAAIDSLHRTGMRSLILDLRGNPGGLLDQGVAVADLFLNPRQIIVSLRGRSADTVYADEHGQKWPDLRIAVLVDRGTASASEIVAGALQDHDRAIVIGRPTYGKGSAQHVFAFRDQAGVKLTTARWYTPSGRNIDIGAPAPREAGAAAADTARPVFKTDSGRKVYGGGGIVPDYIAGDSVNTPRALLFAALGADFPKYREALSAEAKAIAAKGVSDPMFDVTPAMRASLYQRLERSGAHVSRSVFDNAQELIDRRLGELVTRQVFGSAAEERRNILRDKVVEQAVKLLR